MASGREKLALPRRDGRHQLCPQARLRCLGELLVRERKHPRCHGSIARSSSSSSCAAHTHNVAH
eukprot:12600717-Alexandrium_andersonii.AAC.1